jgi:two-component system cell cycle response regulator
VQESITPVKYLKDLTILYVEDDEVIGNLMARSIKREVKEIYRAYNGIEGFELFKEYYPDIIITDIRMPLMNGLEMIQKIREIDMNIKILITSAFSDIDFLVSAIKYNTNGYILKPIDKSELFIALNDAAKSIHYEKAMKRFMKYIQDIIDVQKSLIVIQDKNLNFVRANQNFLKYFNVNSVEELSNEIRNYEFISNNNSIDPLINISIENLEYLAAKNDTNTTQIKRGELIDSFILNVSKLINDDGEVEYLISLTDISEIFDEKMSLEDKANKDFLTGLYNRYKFDDDFEREVKITKRYNLGLSIVMFDIDNFKDVNDTYGHVIGDKVLKNIAHIVTEGIRESDSAYRWGGEEFIILLPNSSDENAYELTERIRKTIEIFDFDKDLDRVTCSFGISAFRDGLSMKEIVSEADSALYQAKKEGKNRTVVYK